MNELEIIIRIALVIILTGAIGLERGIRHKGAGLRTHLLVGLGTALLVLTSWHIYYLYSNDINIDPTRMIAGIITGIGFLCAGTIIRGGDTPNVTGLTTAATLWMVSCIGIAIGSGLYFGAILVSITVFVILLRARNIEQWVEKNLKKHLLSEGE